MKKILIVASALGALALAGCEASPPSSDQRQAAQQEQLLQEGTSAVGMPNIRNFRERRIMKDILELRDQDGLVTYTYQFSEMTGRLVFFCNSMGYPMSAATQFTNPERIAAQNSYGVATLPQADPNGLFSPSSAEGSWVLCVDPRTREARPVYSEPRLTSSPFPLTSDTPQGTAARTVIGNTASPATAQPASAPAR